MAEYAQSGYHLDDRVIGLYRQHAARYALEIVFPEGSPEWFRFQFDQDEVRITCAATAPSADIVNRIAASALAGWIAHEKSFFYARAYSRRHEALYTITTVDGRVQLERRALPDLLMHYLLNVAPGSDLAAKHYVDRQIEAIRSGNWPRPVGASDSLAERASALGPDGAGS